MSEQIAQKTCFVIGPIGPPDSEIRDHADWLFDYIIEPVVTSSEFNYSVERADHSRSAGLITSQFITAVTESDLVIADLSMHNANAFYELALRHAFRKSVIHMIRSSEDPPFDVRDYRTIEFEIRPKKIPDTRQELTEFLRNIEDPEYVIENPVTAALGLRELEQSGSTLEQLVYNLIENVNRLSADFEDLKAYSTYETDDAMYREFVNMAKSSKQARKNETSGFGAALAKISASETKSLGDILGEALKDKEPDRGRS